MAEIIREVPGYDPYRDVTGDDGFWFDCEAAKRACDFFYDHLKHVEGAMAGKPFELELWQMALVGNLFGWKAWKTSEAEPDGAWVRRYSSVFLYVARKNGKTPLVAGIALYVFVCDEEIGQQNYCSAYNKDQANMLFRQAKLNVEKNPSLDKRITVYSGMGQRSMEIKSEGSYFKVIAADDAGVHGQNQHLVVVDEVHAQPNSDLIHTMQTGGVSSNRAQPITLYVTTADYERPSICNELHQEFSDIRDGKIRNTHQLPVIYEMAKDDDWRDLSLIHKANPNLHVSVSLERLEQLRDKALRNPTFENHFRRLHCNQRTEQVERWIGAALWDQNDWLHDLEALRGRACFGGLDLSQRSDMTAFVLVFPPEGALEPKPKGGAETDEEPDEKIFDVLAWFWLPELTKDGGGIDVRAKEDGVAYASWRDQGHLFLTPGDMVDVDYIRQYIWELGEQYDIREIAFDRWGAIQIQTQLQADGFELIQFGQGIKSMSPPSKELVDLLEESRIAHAGHPVLRWHAMNCSVERDSEGNIKPSKKKSNWKIDGIVALIMALDRALRHMNKAQSVYDQGESILL